MKNNINESKKIDVLFVNSDSATGAYQELAQIYSAIEPPTWALLLAQSCRSKGYSVAILDTEAEKLSIQNSINRIREINARLVVFVVYGQNPNSGTIGMIGATKLAEQLKQQYPNELTCFVGSHTSALPYEVLALKYVDFVLLNEGVYALHNLLKTNLIDNLEKVYGIGYKFNENNNTNLKLNPPERIVPQERMDIDLPGYAWDLLPYKSKPLDLYRSHFWHADFDHSKRTPFAAIYTSLGCNFGCDFCMINIVNRVNNSEMINASHSRGMRFWSAELIGRELEKLASMGVETIRFSDEMFFLNKKYYEQVLKQIIDRKLILKIWAYSRIDTVRTDFLELFQKAGVNWLALGIEAGNQNVRQEVSKGSFKEINIREICNSIRSGGMNIISNYIFGFPDDTNETMKETLNLALELNTEMANMYPCQALPGSPMYHTALKNGWKLPSTYNGFGFLSYDSEPLNTKYLSSAQVLKFRDEAWQTYFTNPCYLKLIETKFGIQQRINIQEMSKIKLRRKLLGN